MNKLTYLLRRTPVILTCVSTIILTGCPKLENGSKTSVKAEGEVTTTSTKPEETPKPPPAATTTNDIAPEPRQAVSPETAPPPPERPEELKPARYEVTITNLTAGQSFSPVALISHKEGYQLFTLGEPASRPLEDLAEGGNNKPLLQAAEKKSSVYRVADNEKGEIKPGATQTISISAKTRQRENIHLSMAAMLVRTNDGFLAMNGENVGSLEVGETRQVDIKTYDAGTEANAETAETLPGSGEGFNEARDDSDKVTVHPGVVTSSDGLATSVLTEIHRWNNPVADVQIKRVE